MQKTGNQLSFNICSVGRTHCIRVLSDLVEYKEKKGFMSKWIKVTSVPPLSKLKQ